MRRRIGDIPPQDNLPIHCKYDKLVSTFSLEPNPDNPNIHSNEQIKLLSKIITKNGWRDKIVVSNQSGMIVRGHGRFEAAKLLKAAKVPVEYQDYETYADEVRDLVADNKISEFSHIDKDQMLKLFANVEDFDFKKELDNLGFTEDEVKKMFGEYEGIDSAENNTYGEGKYGVLVECDSEEEQLGLLSDFMEKGLSCKALML